MEHLQNTHLDIFLPFYGDVGLFRETVESVLNQDSSLWRLTIINDAHPDLSVDEWISGLMNPNINYVRNEFNLGPAKNFARCLEFASSTHCMFLGADDLLRPNFISVVMDSLRANPEVNLIQPGVKVIDESGAEVSGLVDSTKKVLRRINDSGSVGSGRALATLMIGCWMYFPSLIWRVDQVREFGFDPKFNVCQDLDLIVKVLNANAQFLLLNDVIFLYRRHSESDSATKLLNGQRFNEERQLYYLLARRFWIMRRPVIALLAMLHLSSRLHGLVILPKTLPNLRAFLQTLRHVVF